MRYRKRDLTRRLFPSVYQCVRTNFAREPRLLNDTQTRPYPKRPINYPLPFPVTLSIYLYIKQKQQKKNTKYEMANRIKARKKNKIGKGKKKGYAERSWTERVTNSLWLLWVGCVLLERVKGHPYRSKSLRDIQTKDKSTPVYIRDFLFYSISQNSSSSIRFTYTNTHNLYILLYFFFFFSPTKG